MKILKKYWWLIVIVVLLVFIFVQNKKINKIEGNLQLRNVELSTLKDSVNTFVTKNGELINQIEAVRVEKGNLRKSLEIAGFDKKELKEANIKLRNLNLALKAQIEATGNISTTIHDTFEVQNTDTIYYSIVDDWTDNKLSLFGGTIKNQKLDFESYTYKTGFKFYLSENRNNSIVTVKFDDENIKLTTGNSISIPHETKWYQKWWVWTTVGATAGVLITK